MLFERHRHLTLSSRLLSVAAVVLAAIAYRFVSFNGFSNDHYMHLTWAQQMLRGDWPGRDFVEPGMPLTVGLSALAQLAGGRGLTAELALCLLMIGVAAGLTCWLAVRLTRSLVLGMLAAGLQIAIFPRLYNYPKLLVPLVGVAVFWRYLDRPTTGRAALIGAWIAAAFLFRHDYLLYLGLAACTVFLVRIATLGRRAVGVHGAACALTALTVVLPYLIVLGSLGGIRAHVGDALEFARGEDNQWLVAPPVLTIAAPPSVPDRAALAPAGLLRSAARSVVFDLALPLAPVVNATNAGVVLYYAAFGLPAALLFMTARTVARRRPRRPTVEEEQTIVLAVLALSLAVVFVRHPIDARLPDVSGPMPLVLLAAAAALERLGRVWRALARLGIAVAVLAVVLHGAVWNRLYGAGVFQGPAGIAAQYDKVWSTLRTPPWEAFWPNGSLPNTVRYLRACTAETDRVLVTWFAPEVFTFTDRGFAAGHSYFIRRNFYRLEDQQRMVTRFDRERVPVVLFNLDQPWFRTRFHLFQQHLDERYTVVGTDRFRDESIAVAVLRDRVPAGVDPATGWPCFR